MMEILAAGYVVVALWAATNTTREWLSRRDATLPGFLGGLLVCLFWLPAFVAISIWAIVRRDE